MGVLTFIVTRGLVHHQVQFAVIRRKLGEPMLY
jgi:hypothetical protein